ncbi:ISLre2 family transposase [Desulforudis sp. Tu-874]|uniref:ISLre2 family transposase n=3 Tax=Candidatus Desulforudis TaxID=471826 RepID=UPI003CE4BD02
MIKVRLIVQVVLLLAKGIFEILRSVANVRELEERMQRLVQEAALRLFRAALEEIDGALAAQRDTKKYKSVGFRERTLITSFGELRLKRRLYLDTETGDYRFLLDEALGLTEGQRMSPRITELTVELATEMPFRRAEKILSYLVPGISAMTIWSRVQESGRRAAEHSALRRAAIFEQGAVPAGSKEIRTLFIEADGVWVRQQRTRERGGEIKLVVGYEGKEGCPRSLKGRQTVAGLVDGEAIWEEASAVFGERWALEKVAQVRIGGDGAPWIANGGKACFPGASYHLDPFHLRRRLTEALAFSEEIYGEVSTCIARLNQEATVAVLDRALKKARGRAARKRIRELKQYLIDNWEGISTLPEEERLGTIEGQVRHTLARRMKRIGARWTPRGADHMARLLAARANGELRVYAASDGVVNAPLLEQVIRVGGIEQPQRLRREDLENWLRAEMPALKGPCAGEPWVKHVLRQLASLPALLSA